MDDTSDPLELVSSNGHADLVEIIDGVQQRIGQDLHDSIQQEIVGLGLISQALLSKLQGQSEGLPRESLQVCCDLAKKLVDGFSHAQMELQGISKVLTPAVRPIDRLADSLRDLACRTNNLHGIRCTFKSYRNSHSPSPKASFQLYRIAQEALCNALKHSGASRILIGLDCRRGKTVLKVADNGNGFHSDERATRIGATLQIVSVPHRGTLVRCTAFDSAYQEKEHD
jgi:two-component system sensor kinase FixL